MHLVRIRICPQKIQSIFFYLYGVLQPILCGREGLTYAHGIRVCYGVCAVMVGMCVSYYDNFIIFKFFQTGVQKYVIKFEIPNFFYLGI